MWLPVIVVVVPACVLLMSKVTPAAPPAEVPPLMFTAVTPAPYSMGAFPRPVN